MWIRLLWFFWLCVFSFCVWGANGVTEDINLLTYNQILVKRLGAWEEAWTQSGYGVSHCLFLFVSLTSWSCSSVSGIQRHNLLVIYKWHMLNNLWYWAPAADVLCQMMIAALIIVIQYTLSCILDPSKFSVVDFEKDFYVLWYFIRYCVKNVLILTINVFRFFIWRHPLYLSRGKQLQKIKRRLIRKKNIELYGTVHTRHCGRTRHGSTSDVENFWYSVWQSPARKVHQYST